MAEMVLASVLAVLVGGLNLALFVRWAPWGLENARMVPVPVFK